MTIPDFDAMFDRHAKAVYNHAFRLTGSWTVAEDVTQATFLTAWRRRDDIRLVDDSPLPWLLVTATHQVRTEQRTLTRWRNRLLRAPGDDTVADPADDVAGRLDDERRMREVLTAVRRLPRAEREAVALCLWSGISYPEAAAALGVAESTVRSRVSRARARLTRQFPTPEPDTPSPIAPSPRPTTHLSGDAQAFPDARPSPDAHVCADAQALPAAARAAVAGTTEAVDGTSPRASPGAVHPAAPLNTPAPDHTTAGAAHLPATSTIPAPGGPARATTAPPPPPTDRSSRGGGRPLAAPTAGTSRTGRGTARPLAVPGVGRPSLSSARPSLKEKS